MRITAAERASSSTGDESFPDGVAQTSRPPAGVARLDGVVRAYHLRRSGRAWGFGHGRQGTDSRISTRARVAAHPRAARFGPRSAFARHTLAGARHRRSLPAHPPIRMLAAGVLARRADSGRARRMDSPALNSNLGGGRPANSGVVRFRDVSKRPHFLSKSRAVKVS